MTKKIFMAILALVMTIAFAACGEQAESTPSADASSDSVASSSPSSSEDSASGQASDDLFAFQVSVDDNLITVPCAASDLDKAGYTFGDKADSILENNYQTSGLMKNAAGNSVSVGIVNVSGDAKAFSECDIDDIFFKQSNSEGQTITFAKGITFGASESDITDAFGEPDHRTDSGDLIQLDYYQDGSDIKNAVKFLFWKGTLDEVDLCTDK